MSLVLIVIVVPILDCLQALLDLVEIVAGPQLRHPYQVRNLRLGSVKGSIHRGVNARSLSILGVCVIFTIASRRAVRSALALLVLVAGLLRQVWGQSLALG